MIRQIGEFECHYSGQNSSLFWQHVNALPAPQRRLMYRIGCMLQNAEDAALAELAEVECSLLASKKPRKRKAPRGGGAGRRK